jgi:hypothetical protein
MAEVELPEPEELREKAKDHFSKRIALVTAIYAVMLAITSLGGNNATKEMMLSQQQASDQWAFYQAKALREHMYKVQKEGLELQYMDRKPAMKPETVAAYEKELKSVAGDEARFKAEKNDIEASAKKLEAQRDVNMSKDPYFDYAEVLLQIAIVLASISIIATSLPVFIVSLFAAVGGSVLCINGFFLLFRIPFFH